MKKISKKKLNRLISMTREYWETGDTTILHKRITLAEAMKKTGLTWSAILDLLDGILANHAFLPEASNDEIYCALRCLGWEASDAEDETSEGL